MCTSIAFFEQKLFGRNLDLEVSFGSGWSSRPVPSPFPSPTAPP